MDYNNRTTLSLSDHHHSISGNYAINGKIMLCSVVILFVVVVILVCFHTYTRWLFHTHNHNNRRRSRRHLNHLSNTTNSQALDHTILKTIPTFIYSTTDDQLLECAVCLSEFEDKEKGRLLPNCNHSFHVDCIDMWFHSHSTCPLCRAQVQPQEATTEPVESSTPEAEMGHLSSELLSILVQMPRDNLRGLDHMGLGFSEAVGNRVVGMKRIWSV